MDKHEVEMIKASLPYMNPRTKKSFEILIKADELMDSLHTLDGVEVSACDVHSNSIDMETFLSQIRALSNSKESQMIDSLLHLIKMQKLLSAYRSFMTTKPENSDNLMDFFLSQMSPEQKSNFENISMMFNAMNN